jgi:gluconolactonase
MARHPILACALLAFVFSCQPQQKYATTGSIEVLSNELNAIADANAPIEIVGDGFEWSEGPVWLPNEKKLLFSDVPKNVVYEWTAAQGVKTYLKPSGFTGDNTKSGESGSNGLAINAANELLLCQHGNRQLAKMNAPVSTPAPDFTSLATHYKEKRLSSPNDLCLLRNGDIIFTDPPYGLPQQDADPAKETTFNGVYQLTAGGEVNVLVDSLTRPNGVALSPDEKTLYVANSDANRARWYAYIFDDNVIREGRILMDATGRTGEEKGLPDGLKVDAMGNVFATGPGGVWIFSPAGKLIGKIRLPEAASNCALTPDRQYLFITMDGYLVRVTLKKIS